MLIQLQVRHFAIVEHIDIELKKGMTAITGETGAGKSIALDALSMCLGARAEASMVRPGADKAQIYAVFDIQNNPTAQQWLSDHELDADDNHECILRRTISKEGRSKAYINGATCPLNLVKGLAALLVNIHGQHEHQLLSHPEHQLQLLDQFASHRQLQQEVGESWQAWQKLRREKKHLDETREQLSAKKQLIHYQVSELQEFNLQTGEYEQIEQDHQRHANASTLQDESAFALNSLYDGEHNNAYSLVQTVIDRLQQQLSVDERLQPTVDLLLEAGVQIEEAVRELRHYHQDIEVNGESLSELEQRMTQAIQLAKKHQVSPDQLPNLQAELEGQLRAIQDSSDQADEIDTLVEAARGTYLQAAGALSKRRCAAAKQLSDDISLSMHQLNMPAARFEVSVVNDIKHASALGTDAVTFLVSANPGQPLQALQKVASGGELSRISLAIQVITANRANTPTLMFDEVDVGISGSTAATVGKLLRQLGEQTQVICVTHLPQVAAKAHQQMRVEKEHTEDSTRTSMTRVQGQERIIELARLLGGNTVTDTALANAQDLMVS